MKTKLFTLLFVAFTFVTFGQNVVVTNTSDSGAGSLRQAILDANANWQIDSLLFNIPSTDAGYNAVTGVYTITINSAVLPGVRRKNLVIDGNSQSRFNGNSNTTVFGTGGTVGVDNLSLSTVEGTEIEIVDGNSLNYGLLIEQSGIEVIGLTINGFGNGWYINSHGNLLLRSGANKTTITGCVLGSDAHVAGVPVTGANGAPNLQVQGADSCVMTNNYVAYSNEMGAYLRNGSRGWTVQNNEFSNNGLVNNICDGLDIADDTRGFTVIGNLFSNNGGAGLDSYRSEGDHFINNNTSTGNGQLGREPSGMRIYGTLGDNITKNKIYDNIGAGVMVVSGATKHVISQNSIYNNGNIIASNASAIFNQIGIDLLSSTNNHEQGTAPFITINDDSDGDAGANSLLNFPVIESATINSGTVTIKGFAPAGSTVEFFKGALFSGATIAQGKDYLFTAVEGSSADQDATTGSYGPGAVNGIMVGTETNANRFEFTFSAPGFLAQNDLITATATSAGSGTSEFGPQYALASNNPPIAANIDCMYIDVNGDIVAKFGYNNPGAASTTIPVGVNNTINPGAANQGQPTNFNSGLNANVFTLTFSAASSRTWTLDGSSVTADINTPRCPADLKVTQSANNNTPNVGDTVTLTVTIENLTVGTPATAVEIIYFIDPNFTLISTAPSPGSFNSTSNIWSIPQVVNGSPATMEVKVLVQGTGTNVAAVVSQNQPDPNSANNSASETLTTGGSSGGNNGGIESEGSMASIIAQRNFARLKSGEHRFYDNLENEPKLQRSAGIESINNLTDFLPLSGPQNSVPTITSPTDLIGITNAIDVAAADYISPSDNRRVGSILALESQFDVYNHTKVVCDRLKGAEMTLLKTVTVNGKTFVMSKLDQENGDIDYAISFVAYRDSSGNYTVDNRYIQGEYSPSGNGEIFNFQVWTVTESLTIQLMQSLIQNIEADGATSYLNTGTPTLPTVYAKSGYYENGKLYLDIVNTVGASSIILDANKTETETGAREDLIQVLSLDSSKAEETVVWNIDFIFDAGFALSNPTAGGTDVLYFADGPWAVDYERNTGVQSATFNVIKETGYNPLANEKHLERGASFTGDLKNYVSVYRMLQPGNGHTDLSDFNQIEFEASLTGANEIVVTIVSDSVARWQDQFKATVSVTNGAMANYTLDFVDFNSLAGGIIRREDIVNITFSVTGDQSTYQPMMLTVDNINFTQNGRGVSQKEFANVNHQQINVYPNPFSYSTTIDFTAAKEEDFSAELYDLSGKVVDRQLMKKAVAGVNSVQYTPNSNVNDGVYLLKIKSSSQSFTKQVVIRK